MAMTRLQMVTEACNIVGKSLNAAATSGESLQTRAERYINWAQRRVAMTADFWELQTFQDSAVTVADVYAYPMESGTNNLGLSNVKSIASIRLLDGENSRKLHRVDYRYIDERLPRFENYTTDRPSVYARRGQNLFFFRIPDDAYSLYIRYNKWPTDLAADGSTSDFSNKDDIVIAATVFEIYLALQEYESAKVWADVVREKIRQISNAEADLEDADLRLEAFDSKPIYAGVGEPWTSPWVDSLEGYE